MIKLEAGDILLLTSWEYRDYGFDGPFKVLKPITFNKALLSEVEAFHKPDYEGQEFSAYNFVGALHQAGYIEDLAHTSVHYANYSTFEPESFPDAP